MSSSFSADTVSGYLGLYVEWSSNVHVAEGYSDVTVKLYVDSYAIYSQPYVIRCDITIDNSFSQGISNGVNHNNNNYRERHLLREYTTQVYHNPDGTKSCYIKCVWYWEGNYGGRYVSSLSVSSTVTLPTIDKSPPSVSCEVINIEPYSFEIKGSSSDWSDEWKYSIDGGQTWQSFPNNPITNNVNVQITNVKDNTQYNVQVQARKQYNHVVGYSQIQQITTLIEKSPPIVSCEVINIDSFSFEIIGNSSDWSDEWKYSIDGGQNWQSFPENIVNNEATHKLTNILDDSDYNVQIQARKKYNLVVGYSRIVKVHTPKYIFISKEYKTTTILLRLIRYMQIQIIIFDNYLKI